MTVITSILLFLVALPAALSCLYLFLFTLLSAKTKNPACTALFERLRARGLAGKQALCAVAARLLRQAWAVLTHNCDSDPAHHLKVAL